MRRRTALPLLLIPCLLGTALLFAEPPKELLPFIEKHCVDCHDADAAKGGLDFGKLPSDLNRPETLAKWVHIFDRVDQGEMPPKKQPQPEKNEKDLFLAALKEPLLKTDQADIAANGRVRSRRLTRVEYEHTLHDLLGIDIPLKTLLPEDRDAQPDYWRQFAMTVNAGSLHSGAKDRDKQMAVQLAGRHLYPIKEMYRKIGEKNPDALWDELIAESQQAQGAPGQGAGQQGKQPTSLG
jgi:hypothetical protein